MIQTGDPENKSKGICVESQDKLKIPMQSKVWVFLCDLIVNNFQTNNEIELFPLIKQF